MHDATSPLAQNDNEPHEPPCPLGPGDVLAQRYAVEYLVGEGTFGWVLAALELTVEPPRRVALKVLRRSHATQGDALYRFERRELELLNRIQRTAETPHVVSALAPTLLWHGDLPFLVLEFIDGPSLRELLNERPPTLPHALRLGAGIARGLAAIHAVGGAHRDLKPANIRIRGDGEPVIVDLGSTRALWETLERTGTHQAPMTPRYASPEQLAGRPTGPPSDVYSLGVILHELLTGELPPAPGMAEGIHATRELSSWVKRCLDPLPERRPTALEMEAALSAPLSKARGSSVLEWSVFTCGLLFISAGAGVLWSFLRPHSTVPPLVTPASPPAMDSPAWSKSFGDPERQDQVKLALDRQGRLLLAGGFWGELDLGAGALRSAGSGDLFMARLEPDGSPLWSRSFGDPNVQIAADVAAAPSGDLVVTGFFNDTLNLGGQPLFSPAEYDVFLARLDPEGRPQWSRQFGDVSDQRPVAVAVDPQGHISLAGHFRGTVDFGSGPLGSAGQLDVFLARFTPEGQLLWGQRFGNPQEQVAVDLAVDSEGNIALAGTTQGSIDLGGGVLGSASSGTVFLAMFDPDGRHRWSRALGRTAHASAAIGFGPSGHLFVAATTGGTAGAAPSSRDTPEPPGFHVSRFDPSGNPVWSHHHEAELFPADLAVTPQGRLIITGGARGSADLGDGPLPGMGGMDVFVLELDVDGRLLQARRFGDSADQFSRSVAVTPGGNLLLAGTFDGVLDFGPRPLTSEGGTDLFISQLSPGDRVPQGDCFPAPAGLVAWYPLDEPEPGAARAGAPPGRLVGRASAVQTEGPSALLLEGGYLEAPHSDALDFGRAALSVAAWIRTSDATEIKMVLDKRREAERLRTQSGYGLFLYRGRLSFQLADGTAPGKCGTAPHRSCTNYHSGRFVADGAWHLVVVTVERHAPDGGTFYVDGAPVGRFDPSLRPGSLDNDAPLRLGSRSSSETATFHGLVDEVTLWDRALSPTEVKAMYSAGRAGPCRATPSTLPGK